MQTLIVGLIVAGCMVYAAWTLMPSGLRRPFAAALLKLSWPECLAGPLRRAVQPSGACGGCDSCGDTARKRPAVQTVTLHRRPPR